MAIQHNYGQFVWRELGTSDVPAALEFYRALFGWRIEKSPMPDMAYWLCWAGEHQVAGVMQMPPDAPRPYWLPSVSVPDVDRASAAATEHGARLAVPPTPIPGIGRFSVVVDPQGAVFSLYRSDDGDRAWCTPTPGEFCWEKLGAPDHDAAKAFYAAVVGWGARAFGAGGDTTTQVFTMDGQSMASLTPLPPNTPPHWLSYVLVDDLGRAHECVRRFGGTVLMERWEVPTVGFIAVVADPQGAVLGLLEAPRPAA